MPKILALLLALAALLNPPATLQAAPTEPATRHLDQLVAETLANNPELEADQARWQAYSQRARQAGTLEDPMLMLQLQNLPIRDPLAFDRDPASAKVIGISQLVPFFGKRDLQREAARLDAEAARLTVEERALELSGMVKETWYQLLFVDRALAIVAGNIAVLDDLSAQSGSLYEVGRGLLQDLLKAQVERAKMDELRLSLEQRRRSLEVALNSLRFRPVDSPIIPSAPLDLTPLALEVAELEELAARRPLFQQLAAREEKAAALRRLAQREFYPDFTLSLEYMQREPAMGDPGYDMYSAGITFNLPVRRDRRHAKAAEAEAEIRLARAEQERTRNLIRRGIGDALAQLDSNRRLATLYDQEIIPRAEHAAGAALASYHSGTADFMNVLDSQMTLFNFQREHIAAIARHQTQLAILETVVGTPLQ
ncbi:MAG: TolC family protein [Desulfurivibrio sp.]